MLIICKIKRLVENRSTSINCTTFVSFNIYWIFQISWFRKENDQLKLLTVGRHTYAGDDRYTLEFQYPGNWRLQIRHVSKKDEGNYECQISTHPAKVIQMFLYINGKLSQIGMTTLEVLYLNTNPNFKINTNLVFIVCNLGDHDQYLYVFT